ncbi:hypothetical protein J6590_035535 [Homalodisca vitripennis]|nr:hypothetical protein J6590_035535 [Homalodisca vitripennis]
MSELLKITSILLDNRGKEGRSAHARIWRGAPKVPPLLLFLSFENHTILRMSGATNIKVDWSLSTLSGQPLPQDDGSWYSLNVDENSRSIESLDLRNSNSTGLAITPLQPTAVIRKPPGKLRSLKKMTGASQKNMQVCRPLPKTPHIVASFPDWY